MRRADGWLARLWRALHPPPRPLAPFEPTTKTMLRDEIMAYVFGGEEEEPSNPSLEGGSTICGANFGEGSD